MKDDKKSQFLIQDPVLNALIYSLGAAVLEGTLVEFIKAGRWGAAVGVIIGFWFVGYLWWCGASAVVSVIVENRGWYKKHKKARGFINVALVLVYTFVVYYVIQIILEKI